MKDQDQYLSVIKFPAFVSLSLLLISAVYFGLVYYLLQKPATVSYPVRALLIVLLAGIVFMVATWVLALMSTHTRIKPRWLRLLSKWMLMHVFFPLSRALGVISFSPRTILTESFLNFNNEIVLTDQKEIHNSNILVLLPHCLQKDDCSVRITTDIINCEECGGCDIARIKKLVSEQQVDAAVATGGSLARKLIQDKKPDVIVAVACHRDLLEGLRDAWRNPVYALLNERPKGPCHETTVSVASIEFAIKKFK
ncbi:MAG: DUF116 domain-containing protein [Candidatus Cloacimonadaceae bacterium]